MKEWRQKEKNKDPRSVLCHESVLPLWLLLPSTLRYHVGNTRDDHKAQRQTRWREFITRDKHYGKWRIIGNWLFTAEHLGDLTCSREAITTLGATRRNGFIHHSLTVRSQRLSTSSTETICFHPIPDSSLVLAPLGRHMPRSLHTALHICSAPHLVSGCLTFTFYEEIVEDCLVIMIYYSLVIV